MTIDEAINHAEEVAEEKESEAQNLRYSKLDWRYEADKCFECANEHRQLAEWLKELKQLREQTKWIPVSESFPKEHVCDDGYIEPSETVLVQLNNGEMKTSRYWGSRESRKDEPWIDLSYPTTLEAVAWQPLPEPYVEEKEKVNCKNAKCDNCVNHNYCDYEECKERLKGESNDSN